MNRETLICEIQRALKEQTDDYPMDFAELSDRTLEGLALLLGELQELLGHRHITTTQIYAKRHPRP